MATAASSEARIEIGDVLQSGFAILGAHPASYGLLALLLAGLPTALTELTMDPGAMSPWLWYGDATYWAAMLLASAASAVLTATVMRTAGSELAGETGNVGSSLACALKLILPLTGAALLTGIIIMIGLLFLIVPGLIAYTALIVTVPALTEERLGVIGAIERSAELTKGSRWRIFALVLVYSLLYMVLGAAVGALTLFGALESQTLTIAATALTGTVMTLLMAGITAALYLELRRAKEGGVAGALAAVFD